MKSVKIKHFSVVGNKYHVAIGNGLARDFKNKKNCLKFLADANRFLTLKLHESNFILSDLQIQFRRNWFYFDHHKDPAAELFSMERNCTNNIRAIEDTFDLLVSRAGFTNGNHFVFMHFKAIFHSFKETLKILQVLQMSKSSAVDVHKLQVIYIRVMQLEKELFLYDGKFSAEQLDADEIFTRNRMAAVM